MHSAKRKKIVLKIEHENFRFIDDVFSFDIIVYTGTGTNIYKG